MDYAELPVPADLSGVLHCVWTLNGTQEGSLERAEPILPDGCPELILNRGLPFEEWNGSTFQPQPMRFLYGQLTRALELRPSAGCDIIGVRLQPHGAYALFGPQAVVADDRVELAALASSLDAAFVSVLAKPSLSERLDAVFTLLRGIARHAVERPVLDLLHGIRAGADPSLGHLKASASLSPRQLERRFLAVVGLRPKALVRIVRLRRLIELVRAGDTATFTRLAHEAGYYDQAHFNRDLKAFTGLPPRAYFGQDLVLPAYFSGVR